jgi:putative phage-type endonuclease
MAMHSPIQLPVRQGTPEWLEMRRTGIGSSDAPVIAGERGSVIELWAEKTGLIEAPEPDADTKRLFEWGHRLEPVIADWYADRHDRPLRRVNRMLRHPDVPWAYASLDRVTAKGRRIVEIKTDRWGWRGGEDVPGAIQAQVQHQLWVTGYEVADVAVLFGGSEPVVYEIERDQAFIDNLVFLETEFQDWVETKTRPPLDGSENARRVLSALHPRNDGTMLPASATVDGLIAELSAARFRAKSEADHAATLENTIRSLIGDADGFEGTWGKVTWKKNADSVRTNWPAVAKAYRSLLTDRPSDELDALESIHSEAVTGPRVLRLALKEARHGD